MGTDDGDIEVDGGKSGAVSALSWNGRLQEINSLANVDVGAIESTRSLTSSSNKSKCVSPRTPKW